ncbi:MAG: membrane protein insertase YidC [Pseudomonadota bacterium]|nr:membrane protein insertase YidC [Pseudomonadota bacterium]MDE3037539.1 membrane protein insertase YidC [Pseudomonadota bacterium]
MLPQQDEPDYIRLFIAIFMAALLFMGWQRFVEWPRRQEMAQQVIQQEQEKRAEQRKEAATLPGAATNESNPSLTRAQRIALSPRIAIVSKTLRGSIALTGARFDDLILADYKETLAPHSPDVTLLSPAGGNDAYFTQIGWVSADGKTAVPGQRTLWQADRNTLSPGHAVTLRWDNGQGVTFILAVSLDDEYMFSVAQRVLNHSGHGISVIPYGYINRAYTETGKPSAIIHEGPLGVMQGSLEEVSYKDLREKGNRSYDDASGWLGITDKYWLSALIPAEGHYKTSFRYYSENGADRYQADYLDGAQRINNGQSAGYDVRFFAGAKELGVLDAYAKGDGAHPPIPLFERAIDFGWLYLLSEPMLKTLSFFFIHAGNFGVAILLLTIVVRLLLFPLANKSFHSMAQMRALTPEMQKIKARYADDQITLQKEMLSLYKREKVNPASGCLPMLIQMPVFFALYKVLYVSIEMRHAPFFGWIKDLSATDPSNIFTGFGLVPWDTPPWMHLGILPIAYCLTMIVQMKFQPTPADATQAKVMKFMPYFLLFVFARMPAGLVLYWTCSNTLSIIQQRVITVRHKDKMARKTARQMPDAR